MTGFFLVSSLSSLSFHPLPFPLLTVFFLFPWLNPCLLLLCSFSHLTFCFLELELSFDGCQRFLFARHAKDSFVTDYRGRRAPASVSENRTANINIRHLACPSACFYSLVLQSCLPSSWPQCFVSTLSQTVSDTCPGSKDHWFILILYSRSLPSSESVAPHACLW